jgi:hypothetical protein
MKPLPPPPIPAPDTVPRWRGMLHARLVANAAVRVEQEGPTGMRVAVPVRPRWWARPPLTWVFPLRAERRFALDDVGRALWEAGRKRRRLRLAVADFARSQRLSFHEARVALTPMLQTLVERGILALAAPEAVAGEERNR